jgi:antagonist of KipI
MIEVLRPGQLTTVQDLGRTGHRAEGVPVSGALDPVALRVANLMVGNPPGAAGLEITLTGPRLHFARNALVALAGGAIDAFAGHDAVPPLCAVRLRTGESLDLGGMRAGCRAYLAVAGGIVVEPVLESRSTYLLGGFGGHEGRALRTGDLLPAGATTPPHFSGRRARWSVSPDMLPGGHVVRLLPGTHAAALTPESQAALFSAEFRIARDSDRMGARLDGPPLSLSQPVELTSEGVTPGTVQLPPGGAPIVLLADGGTTGGYPRVAHVATVDLPVLAQLRPGDSLRFQPIALEAARHLLAARERQLERLEAAIRLRTRA